MADQYWNEEVAARYDATSAEVFDDAVLGPTVDLLAELADGGRALELAVGTGRVALPLSGRGIEVSGIELSQPMADQLRAKPGGERIKITIGDMATTRIAGTFQLVYLVYNTITNLLTQGEQVDCFSNASAHLDPGGHFLIEVFVPSLQRLPVGERFVPFDVGGGHIGVDEYDIVNQRLTSHHFWVDDGRGYSLDSPHRYAWPAEYDLMARLAGMTLTHRWANWNRDPFTSESTSHLSVWTKTPHRTQS
ncbi:MAG: class I SAM-dependent methyltransferase [Actinomycetia bacterium]|nr:class I SAM-dependent methyltransferase [Actinomycetes bacterium]MCP5033149.1 class I SAM-dependent methyltransferase [Actinomycetes bacterium]